MVTRPKYVLIVDDDEHVADAWRRALEEDGHHVTVANNGKTASKLIDEFRYDLVITDMRMPNGSGVMVSGLAKLKFGKPNVIVVSGYLDSAPGARTYRDIADDFGLQNVLEKPVDLDQLRALVTNILEK